MLDLDNLKQLRENKGLSQSQLAKLCGVSKNGYLNWEYGTSKPSEDNLKKLEKFLKED